VLRLLTFGSLSVHGTDGPLAGAAAQPRRLAVLAIIARGGRRGATRGKLLALLWPDADEDQGRRVVTQALYALRRDLGRDDTLVGTQDVRINSNALWCDVEAFDSALARGDAASAVTLYAAPFLDGFRLASAPEFERWADDERLALQHRLHVALEALAGSAEERGALSDAVAWWRRRAADDPLNARVTVALMRTLAAAGDRGGALRHAALFEALLHEELGIAADRDVIALAESIRRDLTSASPESASTSQARTMSASSRKAIAVLPFALLGPNRTAHDDRPWCDELADEMITALLDVPGLEVIARTASFALGANPGLVALRERLGVSHAIEGSVRRTPSGFRVHVRLIETTDGRAVLWERFDCESREIDSMAEQVATRFAGRLSETLTH
jgi:DNA-binding SARP family transcriptional activator